jgi:tripartite ATP-independent transporter DctP family solute receptor
MKEARKLLLVLVLFGLVIPELIWAQTPQVVKVAFTDPPTLNIGDMAIYHPSYAAMLAFKGGFEKYTNGRYTVELYPYGTLGDAASNLEQMISGVLQGGTPADGALAPFYPKIQVFSIPYLYNNALVAYDILDSDFGQNLFEDCARTAGLRVLASYDNGGYRNFSNSRKVIKTAADMGNLKIRTMDIPVHMEIVKALGASPTPIAFMELYSALQTGVVDGQENSAITMLGASLQEVQKNVTLDGHLLGMAFLTFSENWFQGLSPEDQDAAHRAGREASIAARGTVRYAESLAIDKLRQAGVAVYAPTAEELETFRETAQGPAMDWLKKNVDGPLVDELVGLVNSGEMGKGVVKYDFGSDISTGTSAVVTAAPSEKSGSGITIIVGVAALLAGLAVGFVASRAKK